MWKKEAVRIATSRFNRDGKIVGRSQKHVRTAYRKGWLKTPEKSIINYKTKSKQNDETNLNEAWFKEINGI